MPINSREFILNYATNRWQLNYKRNVGETSASIRACNPSSRDEWEQYYYENVRSREHIINLGTILFDRIQNNLAQDRLFYPDLINSITEQDCINYIQNLVIDRTFNGFARERGLL